MNINSLLEGASPYQNQQNEAAKLTSKWKRSGLLEGYTSETDKTRSHIDGISSETDKTGSEEDRTSSGAERTNHEQNKRLRHRF